MPIAPMGADEPVEEAKRLRDEAAQARAESRAATERHVAERKWLREVRAALQALVRLNGAPKSRIGQADEDPMD